MAAQKTVAHRLVTYGFVASRIIATRDQPTVTMFSANTPRRCTVRAGTNCSGNHWNPTTTATQPPLQINHHCKSTTAANQPPLQPNHRCNPTTTPTQPPLKCEVFQQLEEDVAAFANLWPIVIGGSVMYAKHGKSIAVCTVQGILSLNMMGY